MVWLYGLLILTVLILFILFQNIKVFTKADETFFLTRVTFMGLTLYDSSKKEKKTKPKKMKPASKEPQNKQTEKKLEDFFQTIKNISALVYEIGKTFRGRMVCKKFELAVTFGLDDAAAVGILTGVAWSVVGLLYPALDSYIKIKTPKIAVNPIFNQELFHFQYEGIYQIKINHIIYVFLKNRKKLFENIKQMKKGGV